MRQRAAIAAVAAGAVTLVVLGMKGSLATSTQAYAVGCKDTPRPDLDQNSTASTVISFPLKYNNSHGVYEMQFYVGANKDAFTAVPDTGSEYMVVTGKECSGCNTSDGVYDMSGIKVASVVPTLSYGSQDDTVDWYIDDLTSESSTSSLQLEFAVVTCVSGDTNSNIFGLATSSTHCNKAPIIDQLVFEQQEIPPYFTFDVENEDSGTLTLGSEQDGGDPIPILQEADMTKALGSDLGMQYYMVPCSDILVDDKSIANKPSYLIDTGNTEFSCNTEFFGSLRPAMAGAQNMTIKFGKTSVTYMVNPELVAACAVEPWLDESEFAGKVAIFGNRLMKGHILSFNLANFTMSIQ